MPKASPTTEDTSISETITVRPRSTSESVSPRGQLQIAEQSIDSVKQLPESQQAGKTGRAADSQAQFALPAGQDLEPETLTDRLSYPDRKNWIAAWHCKLTSLAEKNTWVIEALPENTRAIGCC